MRKLIAYILKDKDGEKVKTYETISGENVSITIFIGDFTYFVRKELGARYHTIYIDGCFNTKYYYEEIQRAQIMACLRDGEGVIFI